MNGLEATVLIALAKADKNRILQEHPLAKRSVFLPSKLFIAQ